MKVKFISKKDRELLKAEKNNQNIVPSSYHSLTTNP